jgi:hypothetical protein
MKETVARFPRGSGLGPRARLGQLGLALIGLFLVSLAIAPGASATTLASWSLTDFVVNSNAAVVGRVSAIDVRWNEDHTLIQTYVTLDITQAIAGETLPSQIVLQEMGGRVGRQVNRVEGVPVYQVGEEVFVFVERIDDYYRTLGFYQGKYTLEADATTGEERYVQHVPAGAVYVAGPDGMAEPVSASYGRNELIARVREIAGK